MTFYIHMRWWLGVFITSCLLTSTAELLNVRQAGAGRMYGSASEPADGLPCGLYRRFESLTRLGTTHKHVHEPARTSYSPGIVPVQAR